MANKTLTAKVKFDTKSAEANLKRLYRKISDVQKAVDRTSRNNNKLDSSIKKAVTSTNRLNAATKQVVNTTNKVNSANEKAVKSAQKMGSAYRGAKSQASALLSVVKKIAGAYLGMETIKLGINTADTITSAQNKLNNIKGGSPEATAETMDKVYAAAQRSRASYTGMLSDVSKLMTLAGDSFQGNVDNAIRFQEIMSKAYTVGGASSTEAATSMYQLVQALGSGVLQGDELRSVREGAPIAYKKIEEFAQGVFNTEESLKDLASQGVITSDIIVAAIMNSEEEITKSFENTKITFAQTWTNIKNQATRAFQPALEKLTQILNSTTVQKAITGIGYALVALGTILGWLFDLFDSFLSWCANNWSWLKYVVIGAIGAIVAMLIYWTASTLINAAIQIAAWIAVHWQFVLIIAIIGVVVGVIVWLANTTVNGCEFMCMALAVVAAAILLIGIITGNMAMIVIAIIVALATLFLMFAEEIVGGLYWIGAVAGNVFKGIGNFGHALENAIGAICTNIGVAFNNAWHGALSGFWNFVLECLDGLDWLAKPISKIAELFGKSFDYEDFIDSVRAKGDAHESKIKEYVSVSDAWNSGMNTYQYKDISDAYDKGAQVGANIQNAVGDFGSSVKNKISELTSGLNGKTALPDPNNPAYALGNSYDPSGANDDVLAGLDKLNGTTDDINDKMDLTDDELDYLRKLAEMEWKKEFTTAEIKIDMSNYNTINGEQDLDGLMDYFATTLREEMASVAEGIHS